MFHEDVASQHRRKRDQEISRSFPQSCGPVAELYNMGKLVPDMRTGAAAHMHVCSTFSMFEGRQICVHGPCQIILHKLTFWYIC